MTNSSLKNIDFKSIAVKYFSQGNSCSESIVLCAIELGLCDKSLLPVATSFSGGMSSGCLCGAIAGAQMVIGSLYGKENNLGNEVMARTKAKQFIDEFKKRNNATCCRVLTSKFADFHSPERRAHCEKMVADSAEILKTLVTA